MVRFGTIRPTGVQCTIPRAVAYEEVAVPVRPGQAIDPDATRKRILMTSERVFNKHGIKSVTVADIAKAAEASKASIYANFGSKEGLAEETLIYRSGQVGRWLAEGTAHISDGRERCLGIFDLLLDWYAEDDFCGCAIVNAAAENRVTDPSVTDIARHHLQIYRDFLTACLQDAGVADSRRLAESLLILIEGATVITAIDGGATAGQHARALAAELLAMAD
jgi:AcrR family transcriptional regulator